MTALSGVFSFNNDTPDKTIVKKCLSGQKYACGDKTFWHQDKSVVIAQSNFDLDFIKGEKFPIHNKEETVFCFVDGIIYNYKELKEPKRNYENILEILETAYEHEKFITGRIHHLYEVN